jgi:CBS domain-containing protein
VASLFPSEMTLSQSKAEKIMGSKEIVSIKNDATIEQCFKLMKERDKSKIIVVDSNNEAKKIVTLSDISGTTNTQEKISSLKNLSSVEFVEHDQGLDEIRKKIEKNPLLVVRKNKQPIGVITVSDLQRELGF